MCVIDNWLSIELRFCPQSQIQGRQRANLDIEASVHVYLGIKRYRIQIHIPRDRDVRDLVSAALAQLEEETAKAITAAVASEVLVLSRLIY